MRPTKRAINTPIRLVSMVNVGSHEEGSTSCCKDPPKDRTMWQEALHCVVPNQ